MYIVFLGAPGAGKGTQAAVVAEKLGLAHVATGDLFRKALAEGTPLGLQAKGYMEKGKLVPDSVTIQMVLDRLQAPDVSGGIILDGFPRNLAQARALDEALPQKGKSIDGVVYIKVAEKELVKRLGGRWICRNCQAPYHEIESPPKVKGKCDRCRGELYQRADDNLETVMKRLQVYFSETAPLIDYYRTSCRLLEVDGEGAIDKVSARIIAAVRGEAIAP